MAKQLCNEFYDQQQGISLYISDMETTPTDVAKMIPGWHTNQKMLKHLRHIRNSMVHDLTEQEINYTQEDIRNLKEFYQRIIEQKDPLASLRQKVNNQDTQEDIRDSNKGYVRTTVPNDLSTESSDERLSIKEGLIISLIVLGVVLLTVGILVARDKGWI